MNYIDVFNGDADGICALVQLRLNQPVSSQLVTGVKRDIQLLKKVLPTEVSHISVLDISHAKNVEDVERLLALGCTIDYFDHHQQAEVKASVSLNMNVDTSASTCTSLIVNQSLSGRFQNWAITAAFGDNLSSVATEIATQSGLNTHQVNLLKNLGVYINYNGYGANTDDLFFHPADLFRHLSRFEDPLIFIEENKEVIATLEQGYFTDLEKGKQADILSKTEASSVIRLPKQKWARRVSGVLGNELANQDPMKAHAIVTELGDDGYVVSIRAPLSNKHGADELASQFPTGGGRKAAAGINVLPKDELDTFVKAFEQKYCAVK